MADNAIRDDRLASLLVRTMALLCVRNTALEDIHAGPAPVTRTGDYSDVTVVDAEGRRIPWPEVSHFGDDAMRALMREIVDNLYTFLVLSREPGFLKRATIRMRSASRWDEPKIVEDFLPGLSAGMKEPVRLYDLFVLGDYIPDQAPRRSSFPPRLSSGSLRSSGASWRAQTG